MRRTRWVLLLAFGVQSILLFGNLGLLPLWSDELFTLRVSQQPIPQLVNSVRRDVHPPLYFLAQHYWMKLPLASDPVVRMRMLSALFALLASGAVLRFAWPRLEGSWRWWFLALWIVSPCLVLYGRMARSYSLQVLLAVIAIDRFLKFAREPGSRRQALLFALASTLLLYTHYVPGMALLAAANLTLVFRLRPLRPLILPNAVIVLLYSPWIGIAVHALRRVERTTDEYAVMGNPVSEHIVKLGYTGASFLFGESLPWWLFCAGLLLAPGLIWLAVKGAARTSEWRWPLICAGAIAYIGVSGWVTYAFVPARLLFLLPYLCLLLVYGAQKKPLAGGILLSARLAVCVAGLWSYFHVDGYLNSGYARPYRSVVAEITHDSRPTLALVDVSTDAPVVRYYLPPGYPIHAIEPRGDAGAFAHELAAGTWTRICLVRNTHQPGDAGRFYRQLEGSLAERYSSHPHYFQPRARLDQLLIRFLGWKDVAPYAYEVLEFTPREPLEATSGIH